MKALIKTDFEKYFIKQLIKEVDKLYHYTNPCNRYNPCDNWFKIPFRDIQVLYL